MIEPVALADFFSAFFSAALIILAGAGYALFYAWAKFNPHRLLKCAAYLCYTALVAAVVLLSRVSHFSGGWLALSWLMVVGYFFAPRIVWSLCVKTHDQSS